MISPLAPFLEWFRGKRAERQIRAAERRRSAIIAQIADRRQNKREWKPMLHLLRQSTEASLRASVGRR